MATTSSALALKILARDGYRCVYCGRKGSSTRALEMDHVEPRSWGGSTRPDNLVTACSECNNEKGPNDLVTYCVFLRRKYGQNTNAMAARVRAALRKKVV